MGCEHFVGAAGWELGLTVGKEVVMGLWGRIYQWGSGSACGAVM